MTTRSYLRYAALLGAAGVLFSGYLSLTRLTSGICAFEEPCPFFLGHPACYTGFALFAIAFAISILALILKSESSWPMVAGSIVGLAGTLFAGALSLEELTGHSGYKLGLPTCAYGFVFFLALFVLSMTAWLKDLRDRPTHHPA